jgi:hypothetical protein
MDGKELGILESGTLTQADAAWEEARRRAALIGPLAAKEKTPASLAAKAGEQLGLSERTIYTLIRRYKASGGSLLSLVPSPPARRTRRQSSAYRNRTDHFLLADRTLSLAPASQN